jgi:CheY-like chemotaxis protein
VKVNPELSDNETRSFHQYKVLEKRIVPRDSAKVTSTSLQTVKILAVEDHADTRRALKTFLERSGAEVTAVESGRAALQEIQTQKPDVLICDIGMREMNGYQLLERIRNLEPEIASVPAIACTAFVREEDVERAFAVGFQAHLAKPLDPNRLLRTVVEVMAKNKKN